MRLHWIVRRLSVRPNVRLVAWSHARQIDFRTALGVDWTYSQRTSETEKSQHCEWQQGVHRRITVLEIHTGGRQLAGSQRNYRLSTR